METFLYYLLKAGVGIALFHIAYLLLLRNEKNFRFNRFYLVSSMTVSFIIPLLRFNVYKSSPESLNLLFLQSPPTTYAEITTPIVQKVSYSEWIFYMYLTVAFIFFIRFLIGFIKATHIVKKSNTKKIATSIVFVSDEDIHPFSFFNKIVVPAAILSSSDLEMIIKHEKAHVEKQHTLDMLFTELLFIFQWFNPFAWNLKQALKTNLEYLADEQVIQTTSVKEYQTAMVSLADKKEITPFLNALNGSQLKKRIIMMNSKTNKKFTGMKQILVIPVLLLLIAVFSCKEETEITPQETENETEKSALLDFFSPSEDPVYILDGQQITSDEMKNIQPSDIKSIQVIKDSSAMTPDGEKASAKILITTGDLNFDQNELIGLNEVVAIGYGPAANDDEQSTIKEGSITIRGMSSANPASGSEEIVAIGYGQKSGNSENVKKNSEGQIEVRGMASVSGGNPPLLIVDGKEFDGDLNSIDPEKIESFSLQKDESAIKLYGEKAKNGVVLITTKNSQPE